MTVMIIIRLTLLTKETTYSSLAHVQMENTDTLFHLGF